MKLFILAALIAVSSAARLEHLERGYLPPDHSHQGQSFQGAQGHGSFGAQSHGSSFGSRGPQFGSNDIDSTGFASAPVGAKSSAAGFRRGLSVNAATSNQYLPPNHGPSGSFPRPHGGAHSQDSFGASSNQNQFSAQPNSQYGAPQFGQASGFGSQGSSGFGSQGSSGFGNQGSNAFGAQNSHGFGSQGSHGFGSQSSGFGSQGSQGRFQASRQYLAPKTSSSFDKIPQQAFDEQTGYHY